MKRFAAVILSILNAMYGLSGCGKQVLPQRSQNAILRELVSAYGAHGCLMDHQTEQLLYELDAADRSAGQKWADILGEWHYISSDMEINCKKLPDDLPDDDSLVIIVLGFELNPDGTMQDELVERLKVALQCAKQYPNAYVLCTGGKTAAFSDNSEGGQMGKWLLKKGLDKKRLLIEENSLTTAQNAMFSYELLRKRCPQVNTAAIVTSSYHIQWGTLMFDTVFRLNADGDTPVISLDAHSAYETTYPGFDLRMNLQCQTSGMLEIVDVMIPEEQSAETGTAKRS